MKVIFSHGKDSNPQSRKIQYLIPVADKLGFKTESIDYTSTKDPVVRVQMLLDRLQKEKDDIILYGSSMGAYVSLVVSELIPVKGLFLCAPASYLEDYDTQSFKKQNIPITIIH